MARIQSPPLLSQIQGARSYSEQATGLRALRDEITGHSQRKERWIQNGVLELLVNILQNNGPSPKSSSGKERSQIGQPQGLSEDVTVRLLSLQLIASFAYGGSAFLGPLHAVNVVATIIPFLSSRNNPPQLVLAALRTIRNIAEATRLATPGADDTTSLSEAIFSASSLPALYDILSQGSRDGVIQEQKCLVAYLISRLCKTPAHQNALADSGVMDALATILASFVVARGEVSPGAEIAGRKDGLADLIPAPAPPGANLALTLEALSTIVANSRFRSYLLLCSPAIVAVFSSTGVMPLATESRAAWNALEMSGFGSIRPRSPQAIDYLLPAVPIPQARSQSRGFNDYPPLGFSSSHDNLAASSSSQGSTFKFTGVGVGRPDTSSEDEEADEPESPLIPWLIHLARSTEGLERVMAVSLVTSLFKAGFACPEREQVLAVLIVPLLGQLMKEHDEEISASVQQAATVEPDVAKHWAVQERTPDVLARLVGESEILQQAVHKCGVLKMAVKLLKDSYKPQPVQSAPQQWSSKPDRGGEPGDIPPACRLGPPGQVPAYGHKITTRESALKLVAAMATLSNDYRDALVEADAVSYIVESLSPNPGKPKNPREQSSSEKGPEDGGAGGSSVYGHNPSSVIMAACHAIRALARSPKIVRTTMKDHDVGKPINKLLSHPDIEVQIAASAAVINVVTNHSPLALTLLSFDVVETLCKHTHSLNPGLQVNALWALKHLVLEMDTSIRKPCLDQLGSGWLIQLISDDASEEEGIRTRSRPGRRVAAEDDDDEDMDKETLGGEDDGAHGEWTWAAQNHTPQPNSKPSTTRSSTPARKARADRLAIREQALGFIRNFLMITSPGDQLEMVDYLFTELGQDRLFSILADMLKVRVVGAVGRRASSARGTGRDALVLYPQARIVENLAYILVHIAAGTPAHRQLVIAQTELLKLLGGHLNSKDAGVRRALCQLFANLCWADSDTDLAPCTQRASALEQLGFLAKLQGLEADADSGVRERARAAVAQMKTPTV
ncbi:armadillo-type protein [Chaetomium fimeti]|uniref:Armadillo-type protein n=1 Tax=Chaetomium fimeti TaxID=1854472 RepID=A0AAE0HBH5_9PEZI|nr:armadillo-type protein [Chaetomium fimeti]